MMDLPKSTSPFSKTNSEPMTREKVDRQFDPLAQSGENEHIDLTSESLTLRTTDESRVAAAMSEAAKMKKTGSIFSVAIVLSNTGTLGLGVKMLKCNVLAVTMLKRSNGALGPGEVAGVRLGNICVILMSLPVG